MPRPSQFNQWAQYLAGMGPDSHDSVPGFSPSKDSAAWLRHSESLDANFHQFQQNLAVPFSKWAREHADRQGSPETLFYPFSGPDFVYANLLFPNAKHYVLCGLEPCGIIEEPWNQSQSMIEETLAGLALSVDHFLERSYFITKEMRTHFEASPLLGIFPVLLTFLVRTGHEIVSVAPLDDTVTAEVANSLEGVQIQFKHTREAHRGVQTLNYVRKDLRDEFCQTGDSLFGLATRHGRPMVFAKSASYLLHEANFSTLRDFIFSQTSGLVQDPSNIPYRTFGEQGWQVSLHGTYVRAPKVFGQYEQADLLHASMTRHENLVPLNFGFGYLTDPDVVSLMIAAPATNSLVARSGRKEILHEVPELEP